MPALSTRSWTALARLRAFRRKHGPEKCRKSAHGIGAARRELELMISGVGTPGTRASQREELLELIDECRCCGQCELGRE